MKIIHEIDEFIAELQGGSGFRSIMLYGIMGSFNNWVEKNLSPEITKVFNNLLNQIDSTINVMTAKNLEAQQYVDLKELGQLLNRSIYDCKGQDGACMVNGFFTNTNTVIKSILKVYISALINNKDNIVKTTSFQDITKFKSKNKEMHLVSNELKKLYSSYNSALSSELFGRLLSVGKMNRAQVTSQMKVKFISDLDKFVADEINRAYKYTNPN